jgi:hypothetical protein
MIFEKMLTRHFYEINEVCLMLIQSLRKGLIENSLFWGRELILSNEYELLEKTVIQSWILWLGSHNIHWLREWVKSQNHMEKLILLAEFCVLRTKMTKQNKRACLYPFLICARGSNRDEIREDGISAGLDTSNPFILYYSLGNNYILSPSAAIEYISDIVESVIEPIVKVVKLIKPVKMKTLLLGCAVQVACLKTYPCDLNYTMKDYVQDNLAKWEPLVGRRKGRLFAILEKDLIHGKKRLSQDLGLNLSHTEIFKTGCVFWQKYKDCDNDDLVDSVFPDDIPDEWSLEDKILSHPKNPRGYNVFYKPEYRCKQLWGFTPFIKKDWVNELNSLMKTCLCPSI